MGGNKKTFGQQTRFRDEVEIWLVSENMRIGLSGISLGLGSNGLRLVIWNKAFSGWILRSVRLGLGRGFLGKGGFLGAQRTEVLIVWKWSLLFEIDW